MQIRFHSISFFLFWTILASSARLSAQQEVQFTARAPKVVSAGERFRLVYAVNAQGSDLRTGNLEGITLLSGPHPSTSTSVQIYNGRTQQSVESSYTYVAVAEKEGKFSIPPASITVEGKEYRSNPVTIEVIKGEAGATAARPGNRQSSGSNSAAEAVGKDDLFLRMLVSKRELFEGEPVVATLKLYTRVNLADLGNFKAPAFNGFWSESLRKAQSLSFQREEVNGKIYNTAVVQQHVLIPERSGTLRIDPAELTALAQVQVRGRRRRSLFDDFFGSHQNIEKQLATPPVELKIKPLPAGAPAGFSGAVGKIDMSASVDPLETKANEAITLKVRYSGTGNLKLIPEPTFRFPTDFEVYDPKVSNNYNAGASGFTGNKTYEYLLIPRHEGNFEIPAQSFTVFDLNTKSYKTTTVGPFTINVARGEGGDAVTGIDLRNVKEDVQVVGSDIHFIRTEEFPLRKKDRPFFGSVSFYLSYALSLGLFLLGMVIVRQQRLRNQDLVYVKNKKAGKVAQSRLRQVREYMDRREQSPFYKEVLNAQWGYLSDKLNIPQGELNKDKVRDGLSAQKVDPALIDEYIRLLDRCEYAQFAPGNSGDELQDVYRLSANLIDKLESAFK